MQGSEPMSTRDTICKVQELVFYQTIDIVYVIKLGLNMYAVFITPKITTRLSTTYPEATISN